jgi:hypothetical protein
VNGAVAARGSLAHVVDQAGFGERGGGQGEDGEGGDEECSWHERSLTYGWRVRVLSADEHSVVREDYLRPSGAVLRVLAR